MQIVIDIPANYRYRICSLHFVPEELKFDIGEAIAKGTPLKTGHWIPTVIRGEDSYICSECGAECCYIPTKFCPECGSYNGGETDAISD